MIRADGEHLTQAEYQLECIRKAQRDADEHAARIRAMEREAHRQAQAAQLYGLAIGLKMQAEIMRGMCQASDRRKPADIQPKPVSTPIPWRPILALWIVTWLLTYMALA